MTKLYMITGFLGAGKTTFLHEFVRLFAGRRLSIIVNEFGKVGVDGKLLSTLDATLLEIVGGSIFCSCRLDQFEKALDNALGETPDVIVIETSGLSDPTGIRKILSGARYEKRVEYGGCVCLADPLTLPKIYAFARVCKKQLLVCDAVVLNKTDAATAEQLTAAKEIITGQRPGIPVTQTAFGKIPADFLSSFQAGQGTEENGIHTADLSLHSLSVKVNSAMSLYDFTKFLEAFSEDTYRIKGFVELQDEVYLIDCVGSLVRVIPAKNAAGDNSFTVLYGYNLPAKKSVKQAAEWYPGMILAIE